MTLTIQHIRNATSLITLNGKTILVDPMLSEKEGLPPVPFTRTLRRNPIVPLPVAMDVFDRIDAILITHLHFDHFDKTAKELLRKDIPVFCQPADQKKIASYGFLHIHPIEETKQWSGIDFRRISGQHAKGIVAKLLGPVSGFILSTPDDGSLYIAGDCLLTEPIRQVFQHYKPQVCILNTPRAQLLLGSIITMTPEDIRRIHRISPSTKMVAVHLDAISHCTLTRKDLSQYVQAHQLSESVFIPEDGETIHFQ
ncbi:MBL fold metallo-hydrolase [Paenibacillus nanensis]|uniref:MBL fold metallo-hydrolase n=1 Tax=Paenibacillus nanensis TaxID=393251 RepID=A0A3A1UXW7_9BACL|nr:MBL fold metallo-hydrolase [Paenibacillus nanensis]RIX52022.1 MBL fold metallo-hydrolase [Paenibacillus nanensis]